MLREFFGFGGFMREAEGYLSWQHLLFVTALMVVMIGLAVVLARKNRARPLAQRFGALVASAILIDSVEIFKVMIICLRSDDPMVWTNELPLFLCSIQLITIPLAAFSKGRLQEAALDFVCIFGMLGAVLGTYGAGQNYACYPVLSIDNVASGITHAISGFAALYIMLAGLASMKRRNIFITFAILLTFCVAAFAANVVLDYNYMFLMAADGTPYTIVYNWVNGNPVLYPLMVVGLFLVYIALFYGVYYARAQKKTARDNDIRFRSV